jgi:oligopeptidase B
MGAGHGGKSGRWEHLREIAEAYAFVLTQLDRHSRERGNPC